MKLFDINTVWPFIYLKPTRTDLVLDAINGLVFLVIWGMLLGAYFFPAWFPGTVEREHLAKMTQLTVLLGVVYFWQTRYPRPFRRKIFDMNPPDNSIWRHRLYARCGRLCFIGGGLFFLCESVKLAFALESMKRLDEIQRYGFAAILVSLLIWTRIKKKNYR